MRGGGRGRGRGIALSCAGFVTAPTFFFLPRGGAWSSAARSRQLSARRRERTDAAASDRARAQECYLGTVNTTPRKRVFLFLFLFLTRRRWNGGIKWLRCERRRHAHGKRGERDISARDLHFLRVDFFPLIHTHTRARARFKLCLSVSKPKLWIKLGHHLGEKLLGYFFFLLLLFFFLE